MQDYVKGKKLAEAVKKNYDVKSYRNAYALGSSMLNKPRIHYAILDLMDRMGVSDSRLVEKLKEHIFDAKKEVIDGEGQVREIRDNTTAIKALDMAMKIKGAYAPERHEVLGVNLNLYQDLSDEELDRRLQLVTEREALLVKGEGAEDGS